MQVDTIKPTLTAPGTKRLKLQYDSLLSNFAFKFNLRRYTMPTAVAVARSFPLYTAKSTKVGRCRLTLSR